MENEYDRWETLLAGLRTWQQMHELEEGRQRDGQTKGKHYHEIRVER